MASDSQEAKLVNGDSEPSPGTPQDERQKYDLTQKLVPFLDRQLIFPLLEFLSQEDMYPATDLMQAKYDLLKPTNMTDYVANLWKEIHDDDEPPQEFQQKREQVLATLQKLGEDSQKVLSVLEDQEVVSALRQDKTQNLQYLKEHHGITLDDVNVLFKFGQFQYNVGNYGAAADLLYHFRILSTDLTMNAAAAWGKLAAEILSGNWDGAMEELNKVKETINDRSFSDPTIQLYHRTWLIHWSLFPFFNTENGRESLCELFFSPAYINSIQTSSPWILRYLTAAVVTSHLRKRNSNNYHKQVRELVKIIKQETYQYSDPITEFIYALYVDFDFDLAQKKLVQVETVLKCDFFLASLADEFVECARHLISEAYCRIHQVIDIKYHAVESETDYRDLSRRLNLSPEEGEKWIVSLIRDNRSDAKIDFNKGIVIMNHPQQSVYQQVIERTKGLYLDSTVMVQSIKTLQAHAASQSS